MEIQALVHAVSKALERSRYAARQLPLLSRAGSALDTNSVNASMVERFGQKLY